MSEDAELMRRHEATMDGRRPWTLETLLAPQSERVFRDVLFRRELWHPSGSPDSSRFAQLFGWADLRALIESAAIASEHVAVTKNGVALPSMFYRSEGRLDPRRVLALVDRGNSLFVKNLHRSDSRVRALKEDIQERLRERVSISVVVTVGTGGAFATHFDRCDVLAIQVEGSKRWLILDNPVTDPVSATDRDSGPRGNAVVSDVVLNAGELLFVPAGYWHRCVNVGDHSVHLAVLLWPPCAQNVLAALSRELIGDPQYRRPLNRDWQSQVADAEWLRKALTDYIQQLPAETMLAAYLGNRDPMEEY
jgi:hypothetical protein